MALSHRLRLYYCVWFQVLRRWGAWLAAANQVCRLERSFDGSEKDEGGSHQKDCCEKANAPKQRANYSGPKPQPWSMGTTPVQTELKAEDDGTDQQQKGHKLDERHAQLDSVGLRAMI
ncbi:MAG TPA: hypothetical protein VNZ22_07740 [Bacillota bacterium]|nr:hypothetical protein [Bacillota bacterium]